jgi:hypothetical protein
MGAKRPTSKGIAGVQQHVTAPRVTPLEVSDCYGWTVPLEGAALVEEQRSGPSQTRSSSAGFHSLHVLREKQPSEDSLYSGCLTHGRCAIGVAVKTAVRCSSKALRATAFSAK